MKLRELQASGEGIDFQHNSVVGKELEDALIQLRKSNVVTKSAFKNLGINEIIFKHFKLNADVGLESGENAYVMTPDIQKNHILYDDLRKAYFQNEDAEALMHKKHFISGTINMKTATVSGDFSILLSEIKLGVGLLSKGSRFTVSEVVAILLHEIGHIWSFFELLAYSVKTSYLMEEGTKRLTESHTKEQRLMILQDIEKATGSRISNKEELALKEHKEDVYKSIILSACVEESMQELDVNIYNNRAWETLADQFAARLGYSRYLATGLDKIYRGYGHETYMSTRFWGFMSVINILIFVTLPVISPLWGTTLSILSVLVMGNPLSQEYDSPKDRISKIQEQLNFALKDKGVPLEIKEALVKDHIVIDEMLQDMKNNIHWWTALWGYLFPWGVKQKKSIDDIKELETLLNNNLFHAAAALETTLKNKTQ